MAPSADFLAFLTDQLRGLGHITTRRMFSGAGLYCDGLIFALILRDTLYFKVDDGNRQAYEAEGLEPFTYEARGRTCGSAPTGRSPSGCSTSPTRCSTGRARRWRLHGARPRRKSRKRRSQARPAGDPHTGQTARACRAAPGARAASRSAGVSESTAACLTNVRRPCGVSISSRRSATSRASGSGQSKPFGRRPSRVSQWRRLRQRHAHVPRAALACLARQRHHRPERHQVARGVIERLGGQLLGARGDAGRFRLGVVDAAGILHQRVEAAARGPWAGVAVGRQRDRDDAGADLGAGLGREPEGGDPARPIPLHEDVRLSQQAAEPLAVLLGAQVERGRELAATRVDVEQRKSGQMRRRDAHDVGAVRRERAAAHRAGDDARQIEHADARQRPLPGGRQRAGRRLADLADLEQRKPAPPRFPADAPPIPRASASWWRPAWRRRPPSRISRPPT